MTAELANAFRDRGSWGNWVKGYCPACNSRGTMFVASGGYLTCSLDVCPNPTLLADLLEKRGALAAGAFSNGEPGD
jgi:hypothetical protein